MENIFNRIRNAITGRKQPRVVMRYPASRSGGANLQKPGRKAGSRLARPAYVWDRQKVVSHFENYFGPADDIIKDGSDIFIHIVKPTAEHNYFTFFTSGMSLNPMYVPQNMDGYEYAELMIHLPGDWPADEDGVEADWPVSWLRTLAHMPEDEKTWLFYGHTVPNGDDAAPFAENTELGCMILGTTSLLESEEERNRFAMLELDKDNVVYCFTLYAIYKPEMDYKLEHAAQDLFDLLASDGACEIIDPWRRCVV